MKADFIKKIYRIAQQCQFYKKISNHLFVTKIIDTLYTKNIHQQEFSLLKGMYLTLSFCINVIHHLKALLMLNSDIALFMTLRLLLRRYVRIIVLGM